MKTLSSFLLLAILSGCTGLPRMERPITLYKGCPEHEGICKKTKAEVKADVKPVFSEVPDKHLSEWIEVNIDDKTTIKILPAKAKSFKEYVALHVTDLAVMLKYQKDLKRFCNQK